MLRERSPQTGFFDTDQIAGSILPAASFYRRFRELVWPLIRDDDFASLYCANNGRPAISPKLLAMALILQFHENLSDREMEAACQYDLRIKYALGLAIDERPFDHSSLGDFRARLLEQEQEKAVFDRILTRLIEAGLIEKDEVQRIDATHVVADMKQSKGPGSNILEYRQLNRRAFVVFLCFSPPVPVRVDLSSVENLSLAPFDSLIHVRFDRGKASLV